MKTILFYAIAIWIIIFLIGKFDPLNINYNISNLKSIQYELNKTINRKGN
jgi:hypothetical protein